LLILNLPLLNGCFGVVSEGGLGLEMGKDGFGTRPTEINRSLMVDFNEQPPIEQGCRGRF
jgi:hypothetical protein